MNAPNSTLPKIEDAWAHLQSVVAELGDNGLSRSRGDGWTVADHLAHVAAWEASALALLQGRDRAAAMGVPDAPNETDAINHAVWELHRGRPVSDVLAFSRETHDSVVAALSRLSDADLQLPYAHFQPAAEKDEDARRPVLDWIRGDTYEHYAEHAGWIAQEFKDSRAER